MISDPISTLIHIYKKFWLCLGEVNGLRIDGRPVDFVSFEILPEETVTVSYQMLGLWPATLADDPDGRHDWRTYTVGEQSFTVPGCLIQSVNPTTSKTHLSIPFYLLQSTVLVALAASLFQSLSVSDFKMVPKLAPTQEYPYHQGSGESAITWGFLQTNSHLSLFYMRSLLCLWKWQELGRYWINDNIWLSTVLTNCCARSLSRPTRSQAHRLTYLVWSQCHPIYWAFVWPVPPSIADVPVLLGERKGCKRKPKNKSKNFKGLSRQNELLLQHSSRVDCLVALL